MNKTANTPSLNWTNPLVLTLVKLLLADIQEDDDGFEIIVQVHQHLRVCVQKVWIVVITSSGNYLFIIYIAGWSSGEARCMS